MQKIFLIELQVDQLETLITDCILSCLKHHKFDFPVEVEKDNEYLTGKQVDQLLNISPPTRHKYANDSILKKHKIGGRVLYKKSEVLAALKIVEARK